MDEKIYVFNLCLLILNTLEKFTCKYLLKTLLLNGAK